MQSLVAAGLKERISHHGDEYRATLYTEDGFFVAWYRRGVTYRDAVAIHNTSCQFIVGTLNYQQILIALGWLIKQEA